MAALALLVTGVALGGCLARGPADDGLDVEVRWTDHGIPHIRAQNWFGLGVGYGFAEARDELCTLAEGFVTVGGQRSLYFGEDSSYGLGGPSLNGTHTFNNLDSDLFWRLHHDDPTLLKTVDLSDPRLAALAQGYVDGYNRHLADLEPAEVPVACRGADWLRPISVQDLERRGAQLQLFKSSEIFLTGMTHAAPPGAGDIPAPSLDLQGLVEPTLGSNAIAVGKDASGTGAGILLGNPHFPWQGMQRFHQSHVTIPGELDAFGVGLLGFPMPLIGFTDEFAWSHTVSTNWPFTLYELTLVPGMPTTYLVDGVPTAMEARTVSVQARTPAGDIVDRSHTFYLTRYGPVLEYDLVKPATRLDTPLKEGLSWTPVHAYAIRDANAQNDRMAEHWLGALTADSFDGFIASITATVGNPWTNTIAASRDGRAYYGMMTVVPDMSPADVDSCMAPIGQALYQLARLPVLDGSGTACDWREDPASPQPGILPGARLPSHETTDYVMNANDSHWVPHPDVRLTGFSKFAGPEGAALSGRTRMGFQLLEERRAGQADCTIDAEVPCDLLTQARIEAITYDRRTFFAGDIVPAVQTQICPLPLAVASQGQVVNLAEACSALAAWGGSNAQDDPGLPLFERFMATAPQAWLVPFDAADPFGTPRGFVATDPRVRIALAEAVLDLQSAGIPLDATSAQARQIHRNGDSFTFDGGAQVIGSYNSMVWPFARGTGYGQDIHGNSYVQVVTWDEDGPLGHAVLAYSQSDDPANPHYADQTAVFSRKDWVLVPFDRDAVNAATKARVIL